MRKSRVAVSAVKLMINFVSNDIIKVFAVGNQNKICITKFYNDYFF